MILPDAAPRMYWHTISGRGALAAAIEKSGEHAVVLSSVCDGAGGKQARWSGFTTLKKKLGAILPATRRLHGNLLFRWA